MPTIRDTYFYVDIKQRQLFNCVPPPPPKEHMQKCIAQDVKIGSFVYVYLSQGVGSWHKAKVTSVVCGDGILLQFQDIVALNTLKRKDKAYSLDELYVKID